MNLLPSIAAGLLSGGVLGALYFLWLWWTLQGLVDRRRAGLWFAANIVARFAFALGGFALVARWGGWPALAAAAAGFVVMRSVLLRRLTGPAPGRGGPP